MCTVLGLLCNRPQLRGAGANATQRGQEAYRELIEVELGLLALRIGAVERGDTLFPTRAGVPIAMSNTPLR